MEQRGIKRTEAVQQTDGRLVQVFQNSNRVRRKEESSSQRGATCPSRDPRLISGELNINRMVAGGRKKQNSPVEDDTSS